MSLSTDLVKEVTHETPHEVIRALASSEPHYAESAHRWVFRGQQDGPADREEGELVASAHRAKDELASLTAHDISPIGERTTNTQLFAEFRLIMDFAVGAVRGGFSLPGFDLRMLNTEGEAILRSRMEAVLEGTSHHWPIDNLLCTTAIAQHYGIPTCMLDWTDSGRTALYFAATGASRRRAEERGDIAVWAMNVNLIRELFPDDATLFPGRIRIIEAPRYLCPNLAAQRGLFSVAEIRSQPNELFQPIYIEREVASRLDSIEDGGHLDEYPKLDFAQRTDTQVLIKHTVSGAHAGKLLRLLVCEGISPSLLFPGYSGVVESIQQEQAWDVSVKHNRWDPREEIQG